MPWSEEEFRRALEGAAEEARPGADALAMLRARSRRHDRFRTFRATFVATAAAAAVLVFALTLRPTTQIRDVEFAATSGGEAPSLATAPVPSEDADGGSILPEVSGDGRFVAFMSEASNLVPGDTNRSSDTFVRDLFTGTVERVSVSSTGEQGNADSLSASISRDGRYVGFRSRATNLVERDTNQATDIFVRDRMEQTTTIVSVPQEGGQANGDSDSASISANGRYIVFRSLASNLLPDDTNGRADIFLRDMSGNGLSWVTRRADGVQANGDSRTPQIAPDGLRVAFSSYANNLVDGDTNRTWDVFVGDIGGDIRRVSVSSDGAQGNAMSTLPSISNDGNVVTFVSDATNLVRGDSNRVRDAFLRDLDAGTTVRVSVPQGGGQADARTLSASLSGDARFIALSSNASNLVRGDVFPGRDIFLIDRQTGRIAIASVASDARPGDGDSGGPSISVDGRYVAFQSYATTFAAGDVNGVRDVFVHDLLNGTTIRASTAGG
jgi:Tol biopolymer transport system component